MYCGEAAKKSQAKITELLLFRKSAGVILRDALPFLQKLCANGPFEDCQVRMFVKQPNRQLQQLLAVENKILQQIKPLTLYMMFKLTLIFHPHHTGMRSEKIFTNGSFEICQERMFVKQRRKNGWSIYLLRTKIFILKQKYSNLYIIMFEVSENVSEYVCMHTAVACIHKCFTLTGGLKSDKCECLWSSAKHTAEAVVCRGKIYLS